MFKATEDICLTQDRQRAVPITHPEAFSLLVAAGGELGDEQAAAYGLTGQAVAPQDIIPQDVTTVVSEPARSTPEAARGVSMNRKRLRRQPA